MSMSWQEDDSNEDDNKKEKDDIIPGGIAHVWRKCPALWSHEAVYDFSKKKNLFDFSEKWLIP